MRTQKEPVLKARAYVYNFDRMVYVNRAEKKAFSVDWLEDHSDDELQQALDERNSDWRLYLNSEPSQAVIDTFLAEVNG
ncbi:MAG: hypothetical protein DMF56_21670 [Acidobacteria bacterium]|nr:MAG: hypothetical protein DMF56_21670 [Acidobacteriota bacterium]